MNDDLKYIDEFVSKSLGEIEIKSPPTGKLAWRVSIFSAAILVIGVIVYFSFFNKPNENNNVITQKSDSLLEINSDSANIENHNNIKDLILPEDDMNANANMENHSNINPFNKADNNSGKSVDGDIETSVDQGDVKTSTEDNNENNSVLGSGITRDTVKTMIITDTVKVVVQPDVVRKKKNNRRD